MSNALDTIDLKVLGQRLREAREAAGISIEEASKHLETADAHIDVLEAGIVKIEPRELLKLSALYRTQVYLLLNGPLPYRTDDEIIQALINCEMTEGLCAHLLGVDYLECRKRVLAYANQHNINLEDL